MAAKREPWMKRVDWKRAQQIEAIRTVQKMLEDFAYGLPLSPRVDAYDLVYALKQFHRSTRGLLIKWLDYWLRTLRKKQTAAKRAAKKRTTRNRITRSAP